MAQTSTMASTQTTRTKAPRFEKLLTIKIVADATRSSTIAD
jgi:hypothetical protein